ncbi:anti-sigma factor, partial [Sphingomonas sp. MMSM20]|nr:anti-sigma factor [Sphingomonas lycopersici]
MAETIDEARIIAWVDGELDDAAAARVAGAVAADPALAALAERHRRMKARFAAAFAPLADAPAPERPAAEVVS